MTPMRLGYAINQWKPNFDDFTRKEQHIRAFKVLVAAGFTGIELRAGTGRWDPLGRPASIAANYGSVEDFVRLINDLGIEVVAAWFFDPGAPIDEELSRGRSILDADDHSAIAGTCRELAAFLAVAGGERIVVRALPSAWQHDSLAPADIAVAARGWNLVGQTVAEYGVRVSLHADVLSAAANTDVLARLLEESDEAVVGLTIDTGELTLAGLDVVDLYERHADRVDHIQLKDTRYVDSVEERFLPYAERTLLQEGGRREVERWFHECGTAGGLVDFPGLMESAQRLGYEGWLVFESDPSPNPAGSVMLNSWYAQHQLGFSRRRQVSKTDPKDGGRE